MGLPRSMAKARGTALFLATPPWRKTFCPMRAVADDAVEVVGDDGADDARGDVLAGGALLDGLADVRVDEGRAVLAELQGGAGGQRDVADLRGAADVEVALGRLLEEGARARRAGLVHRVVDRHAVLEEDVLRVLAADLEDRVDVLGEVGGADGVGDDLVVDALGLEEDAEDLARGARRRGQGDA